MFRTINPTHARELQIRNRLGQIHQRLAVVSDIEAKAAPVGGIGSRGEFEPERDRLTSETDRLLDELTAMAGNLPFQPRA